MVECQKVEEYSLRFINVALEDVNPIKELLPDSSFQARRYFKDRSRYVVVIDLKEGLNYELLETFINENCTEIDYDVFVSVSTDSDSEIIDIPAHIVGFIRKTKGRLTFSFTITE